MHNELIERAKGLAIIALLALAGCAVGVVRPLWECQTVDGKTVIIPNEAEPTTFGGKDADGWEWPSEQIKVCREVKTRP